MRAQDLTGQRFDRWTVIRQDTTRAASQAGRKTYWLCECDCGATKVMSSGTLTGDGELWCKDCYPRPAKIRKTRLIDVTGQRFGAWLVIEKRLRHDGTKLRVYWLCRCDCGTEAEIESCSLRSGRSTQCVNCRKRRQKREDST